MGIEVEDLCYSYGKRRVLRGLSFTVADGEFLSILGPNGVGKSTLFRCVLGLLRPESGRVLIDGRDVGALSPRELSRHVAYIPQNSAPAFNFSVEDIVLMGASGRLGSLGVPGKKEVERVHAALKKLGIAELWDRCFHHLSGGERQLVIIARALVQDAAILMLDEPTASLDYGNQIQVLSQARRLTEEGYTVIQTTHDPETAYMFSDRILAMKDGGVLVHSRPEDAITSKNMTELYGLDVEVKSLCNDRLRVCAPGSLSEGAVSEAD